MSEKQWKWFGQDEMPGVCRFHLCTVVGDGRWVVSTVGELWPARYAREIHAYARNGTPSQGA